MRTVVKSIIICVLFFLGVYITHAATLAKPPNNLGLVGYWSLNEGNGTIVTDFSGRGASGTMTNMEATDWVNGKFSKALSFGGTDEYVNINSDLGINALPFTLSAWIKTTALGTASAVGLANTGNTSGFFWVGVGDTGAAALKSRNTQIGEGTRFIADGQWHHVVAVFNSSGTHDLYVDGTFENSFTLTNAAPTFNNVNIGRIGDGSPSDYVTGQVDEVRVYNRVLSASEIAALYRSGAVKIKSTGQTKVNASQNSKQTTGLIGNWSFNGADITGSSVLDRSATGANGTMTNFGTAATSSKVIGKVGQALDFDGTNDYITVTDNAVFDFNAAGNYTWSVWYYPENLTGFKNLWAQNTAGNAPGLFLYAATTADTSFGPLTNGVAIGIDGAGANDLTFHSTNNVLATSTWAYITVTYDGSLAQASRFKIYVNSIDVTDTGDVRNVGTVPSMTLNEITIGANTNYGGEYVDGKIDEMRYYNTLLTAAQIKQLYLMGR